jgi:ubiquinone/menaquinone biosynthesis C-methylase UbiE
MNFVNSYVDAWDRDYRNKGRLWGGSAKDLPSLPAGSVVLEMGCGDGKTLASMPTDGRIAALDTSPEALRLSRTSAKHVDLILANACFLPFRKSCFDFVFAFHVTGHMLLPSREALAREAGRVLKSGGKLFFREFGAEDMRSRQGDEVESGTFRRGNDILTHYFTKREVEGLFDDLEPIMVSTHRWNLRVKGQDLTRAEVEAVFLKI